MQSVVDLFVFFAQYLASFWSFSYTQFIVIAFCFIVMLSWISDLVRR